ncbi:ABC transporter ATP-binding protein [Clostridiaceae bacterium UIB06]|uniref:ABC transporter ATP-binding protein n=1 Tax=Clostridium thailandense TaxID=2794346 RepID=A0A949TM61_9CLOT|nr:ABC transporter ATP-binding protein [Clostridium thailandense]MBV7271842.1 ABC transporter ATP-binding protein [Clostridium thailandense]MCH5136855.1 ABC transporter ATP-binding protein [Clostridiaceae bacterium UIB06]
MIRFRDITVAYGKDIILENVNLEIEQGEIITLLDPNGSGKTALISTLNGFIKTVKGSVTIDNKDILKMKPEELARRVAIVPQFHNTSSDFKVFDMVLSGRTPYIEYMPEKSDREKAMDAIQRVGIEYIKDKKYTRIGGGERKLVMIARAIAQERKIIVLNEPATYLDLENQIKVLKLIYVIVS